MADNNDLFLQRLGNAVECFATFTKRCVYTFEVVLHVWGIYSLYNAIKYIWNEPLGLLKNFNIVQEVQVPDPRVEFLDSVWLTIIGLLQSNERPLKMIIVGIVVSIFTAWLTRRRVRRAVQKMRGVKLEAMRVGSKFRVGKIPNCQIAIKRQGVFVDSHVGFGIRVNDFLVVPTHVLGDMQEIILSVEGRKSYLINVSSRIESKIVSDLTYIKVSKDVWSVLGAQQARLAREVPSVKLFASVAGYQGITDGMLACSSEQCLMTYGGSTVPGMSGAAYMVGNVVHAIHTGEVSNENMGISSVLIYHEISSLVSYESSDLDALDIWDAPRRKAPWDTNDIKDQILRVNKLTADEQDAILASGGSDSWARSMGFENAQVQAPASSTITVNVPPPPPMPRTPVTTSRRAHFNPISRTVDFAPHGVDSELSSLVVSGLSNPIEERFILLENRVAALEAGRTVVQDAGGEFPCTQCAVVCTTQSRLDNHLVFNHSPKHTCDRCGLDTFRSLRSLGNHRLQCKLAVASNQSSQVIRGESSNPADFKNIVKMDRSSFLGKKRRSPPRVSRPSGRNSKSLDNNPRYQHQLENRSEMNDFRNQLQEISNLLQRVLPGPSSAMQPSSSR